MRQMIKGSKTNCSFDFFLISIINPISLDFLLFFTDHWERLPGDLILFHFTTSTSYWITQNVFENCTLNGGLLSQWTKSQNWLVVQHQKALTPHHQESKQQSILFQDKAQSKITATETSVLLLTITRISCSATWPYPNFPEQDIIPSSHLVIMYNKFPYRSYLLQASLSVFKLIEFELWVHQFLPCRFCGRFHLVDSGWFSWCLKWYWTSIFHRVCHQYELDVTMLIGWSRCISSHFRKLKFQIPAHAFKIHFATLSKTCSVRPDLL